MVYLFPLAARHAFQTYLDYLFVYFLSISDRMWYLRYLNFGSTVSQPQKISVYG